MEKAKKLFEDVYREASAEKSTTQEGGVRFSLMAFEKDGRRFVEIDQDQHKFDGHSADEFPGIAKEIIKEKFENKVVGVDNKMFVNGAGRNEFVYPSKPIKDAAVYEAKMRASSELDNLLDAGTNLRTEADGKDGHVHLDAVGGFDHFDTLFKIGKRYFEARVNIKNIKRGKLFKDVTQIKDVTQAIMSSYGENPKTQFLRTSSMDSISDSGPNVNQKMSLSAEGDITPVRGGVYGKDIGLDPGMRELADALESVGKKEGGPQALESVIKKQDMEPVAVSTVSTTDAVQQPEAEEMSQEEREYREESKKPVTTFRGLMEAKLQHLQKEVETKRRDQRDSGKQYEEKIRNLQAEYATR